MGDYEPSITASFGLTLSFSVEGLHGRTPLILFRLHQSKGQDQYPMK